MGDGLGTAGFMLRSAIHLQLATTFSNTTTLSTLRLDHFSSNSAIHLRLDLQQGLTHISYSDDVDITIGVHHSFEYSSHNPVRSLT
jgi:hypothetical protein